MVRAPLPAGDPNSTNKFMANTKSALKRDRQTKSRTVRNRAAKSRVKTLRRKVSAATESGDAQAIASAMREFASTVDKAAKKGVIHKNKAANLKSKAAHGIAAATKES
jgi:small subunit ribosomal protein S20